MRTLGVDLAAQDAGTAVCSIDWDADVPVVALPSLEWTAVRGAPDNDRIGALIRTHDKTGIDCPFGWPVDFVALVDAHHRRGALPAAAPAHRLAYRVTDEWVRRESTLRRWPLSVATDRIGVVALRCAALLDSLAGVDRSGVTGPVAETYPAAALATWGLNARGYKGDNGPAVLDRLVDELLGRRPLVFAEPAVENAVRRSHDGFDALVCAIVARLVVDGRTVPPPAESQGAASVEGWINVPDGPDTLDAITVVPT